MPIRRSDLARATAVAFLTLGAALGCEPADPPGSRLSAEAPVRLVLVTVDTLRADRLDPLGSHPSVMPRTRAFAERGAWFSNSWAASSTTQPTHATLFTGLDPWEHGVARNGLVLTPEHETLAERLRAAGFATHAVVGSFPLSPRFGYDQGFDTYDDEFEHRPFSEWGGEKVEEGRFYRLCESVTNRALELLDEIDGARQFVWIHYFDPHAPYGDHEPAPIELRRLVSLQRKSDPGFDAAVRDAARLYDRDLERLDRSLGALFERLDRDAERIATHVVITADHGESFGEHGAVAHGERVTREQVQVPLVIVSPEVEPGVRRDGAGSRDLMTTLLSLAGAPHADLPGRDLSRPAAPGEGGAVGMSGVRAVTPGDGDGRRKRRRFFVVEGEALYAGTVDRVNRDDVPARELEPGPRRDELQRRFRSFAETLSARRDRTRMDEETRRALEALGYVE